MTSGDLDRSVGTPPLDQASDDDLVRAALDGAAIGDTRALDVLIERHQGHVRANCEFLAGEAETARDLAQEVMVKAYFGLDTYRGEASFRTWIRRVKVNHCLNHLARARPDFVDVDSGASRGDEAMSVSPDVDVEAPERRNAVAAVLGELTETLRVPLVLRDVDGFSYDEIAGQLDIKLSAAKMRVARGREQFREVWTRRFGDAR
ncbi:RNA polymerase sigma factor [Gaopeijia maritima]|uniref:Sigma-70 family RNA polymerase sigma factor n=1 Tax=Gaopeijia maritima TaxID=3119007 RepID=A0ABU9ED24_9BACT